MKRILTFIIALAFTLGVSAQNYDVIEPELQKVLNQKSNDKISINIVLDTQADNEQLLVKYEGINDKSFQRENVIKELKAFATDNQNKLIALLQDEAGDDKVVDIKAHWIVNTINCTATTFSIAESSHFVVGIHAFNDSYHSHVHRIFCSVGCPV